MMENNNKKNIGEDFIPEGTFEADLSDSQKAGVIASIDLGLELKSRIPNLADDYKSGLSLESIVEKYNLAESITFPVARNAVRLALVGCDGELGSISANQYDGLMSREEYEKVARSHLVASGKKQYEGKLNIHSQTQEERREVGRLGAMAQGSKPYEQEEFELIKQLSEQPEYQRKSRINAQKIAEEINNRLYDGEQVRTPTQIKKMFSKSKKIGN